MVSNVHPNDGETIFCEYCGKTVEATLDMEHWLCLSEVKAEEESNWSYFCSGSCLKTWINEKMEMFLTRTGQDREDAKWHLEEQKRFGKRILSDE